LRRPPEAGATNVPPAITVAFVFGDAARRGREGDTTAVTTMVLSRSNADLVAGQKASTRASVRSDSRADP